MSTLDIILCIILGIMAVPFIIILIWGFVSGEIGNERYNKPKKKKSSSNPTREQLNRYYRTGNRRFLYDKDFRG